MKLGVSHQRPQQLSDEHLAYLRQLGVEAVEVRLPARECSFDTLRSIKSRVEGAGIALHEVMLSDRYSCERIAVGMPEAREDVKFFCSFLEDLARAGISATTYAWHTGGMYQTERAVTRGCDTRSFHLHKAEKQPEVYGRQFSRDLLWRNYEEFIGTVLPVAERVGVRLQLHPNDPPVDHGGVPRLFQSTAAFRRAMSISSHSVYSGILFCVGTWAEMPGPEGRGENVAAAIREFGSLGLIHQVHLRNIDRPMPDFKETLPDDGYLDLYEVVRELAQVGFDGMIVPDHIPTPIDSTATRQTMEAFSLGHLRGLIQATTARAGQWFAETRFS
jgi:mannonate dehydratase